MRTGRGKTGRQPDVTGKEAGGRLLQEEEVDNFESGVLEEILKDERLRG